MGPVLQLPAVAVVIKPGAVTVMVVVLVAGTMVLVAHRFSGLGVAAARKQRASTETTERRENIFAGVAEAKERIIAVRDNSWWWPPLYRLYGLLLIFWRNEKHERR